MDVAGDTTETFWRDAIQLLVHMLSSRGQKTSSVEQSLDGEPPLYSRESAGPDDGGRKTARLLREWSN
jgi:hypothetical protein